MKQTFLFFIFLVIVKAPSYAGTTLTGRTLWEKSDVAGKVRVLETYKKFLLRYENSEFSSITSAEKQSSFNLLSSAWADDALNCLYAGWPSVAVNGSCTSPVKGNPQYENGNCGVHSMQCQPLMFGKNICVPTSTVSDRQSAFKNCNKKFKESGASSAELVKSLLKNNEEKKLLELFDFAEKICKTGKQAKTGMCKLLLSDLEDLKKGSLEEGTKSVVSNLKEVQKISLTVGKTPMKDCLDCQVTPKLKGRAPAFVGIVETIQPSVTMPPFERVTARIAVACGGSRTDANGIDVQHEIDCKTNEEYAGGYGFANYPGHPYLDGVKSLYEDGGPPNRRIEFVSRDNASNETFLYLTDVAGGPDSHDVKSVMYLLPRKGVPYTEVVGDDVIVTMTTGEKVIFDKKTHAIKSGALMEGPIDLTTDRFKRQPPNIKYTGEGISIRVNHRFEYPTMAGGAESAEVRQGSHLCKVPRAQIWDANGKLLSDDDKTFVDILNKNCPPKGNEVQFHL